MNENRRKLVFRIGRGRRGMSLVIRKTHEDLFVLFCRALQEFLIRESKNSDNAFLNAAVVRIEEGLQNNSKTIKWEYEFVDNNYYIIMLKCGKDSRIILQQDLLERLVTFLKEEKSDLIIKK